MDRPAEQDVTCWHTDHDDATRQITCDDSANFACRAAGRAAPEFPIGAVDQPP